MSRRGEELPKKGRKRPRPKQERPRINGGEVDEIDLDILLPPTITVVPPPLLTANDEDLDFLLPPPPPPPPTTTSSKSDEDEDAMDIDSPRNTNDDEEEEKPAAKRQRKNDPVRKPVRAALLPGAEYSNGMLQVSPAARKLAEKTSHKPTHVMPKRAEQNGFTLTPPTLRPFADFLIDRPLLWHDNVAPHDILRLFYAREVCQRIAEVRLDPSATPAQIEAANIVSATNQEQLTRALNGDSHLLSTEAPQLLSQPKKPRQQRQPRLVDARLGPIQALSGPTVPDDFPFVPNADGKALKNKQKSQQHFHHESQEAFVSYYHLHDPEPDPSLPFGLPPLSYPSMLEMMNEKRVAFEHRHERLQEASEHMPRVSIEHTPRAYLNKYRQPLSSFPVYEERTGCCCGDVCIVMQLAQREGKPHLGYVLPSFLRPSEEGEMIAAMNAGGATREQWKRNHWEPGPCIECTLNNWTKRVLSSQLPRKPPEHPINTIRVAVGEGEYSRECLLPSFIGEFRTGIEHHVPVWDYCYRQFDPQPGDTAILREVNVDFHMSLRQTNACLGVRKAQPLAGAHGFVPLETIKDSIAWFPSSTAAALLWKRFTQTLPMPLLADRALKEKAKQGMSRVPAVCLRLSMLSPDEKRLSPLALECFQLTMPPSTLNDLTRLFQCTPMQLKEDIFPTLGKWAFTTFEQTVAFILQQQTLNEALLLSIPLLLLFEAKRGGGASDWAVQVFAPHSDKLCRPPQWTPLNTTSWILYTACVWRIAVALLFQGALRPWHTGQEQAEYMKQTAYYMDMHLDWLTVFAMAPATRDDAWFLSFGEKEKEPRLTHVYPQCTRVCCAEELPCLTPLLFGSNLWCDMPRKKQHTSMQRTLEHLYLKIRNSICLMRGSDNITFKSMASYPAIQSLVMLVLRCGWLGNFPNAEGRPALPARIRINATFAPRSLLLEHVTAAQEEAHCKSIRDWVKEHPMLTSAMLREHFLYLVELTVVIDTVLGQSRHWPMFKTTVRLGNTQLRRAVNEMIQKQGREVDWSILEKRIKDGRTSVGEVLKWHELEKEHNIKLFKDTDYGIMLKKMTQIEDKITFDSAAVQAWAHEEGRLEAIHVYAWSSAFLSHMPFADGTLRPAVPTGMLKCLGMTEKGFHSLRLWLHASVEYAASDNSFVSFSQTLYNNDWRDYLLLKLYLRLYEFYTDDLLGFTSLEHYRAQLLALRNNLSIPDFVATTPTLGFAYYCVGCLKWAHSVARPSREYLGMPLHGDRWRQRHRRRQQQQQQQQQQRYQAPVVGGGGGLTKRGKKKKKEKPIRPFPPKPLNPCDGRSACMNGSVFNPLTGEKHCTRGNAHPDDVNNDEEEEEEEEEDVMSEDDQEELENLNDVTRILLSHLTCKAPLAKVDLCGAYKRLMHRLYTRCCYCGSVCEVLQGNVTNVGISCGSHALVNEYPKSHPLWRHIIRPSSDTTPTMDNGGGGGPQKACWWCGLYDMQGTRDIWIHDCKLRLAKVTLCRYHASEVKPILPRPALGEMSAPTALWKLKLRLEGC